MYEMKISKKLPKLNMQAENCLHRDEAKKIIRKAKKVQSKIKI